MNKTLMRISTLALLLMVSMGTWADVTILGESSGTSASGKYKGSASGNTFSLTVTPATGYKITKAKIEVYETIDPTKAGTRADIQMSILELSGPDEVAAGDNGVYTYTFNDTEDHDIVISKIEFTQSGTKGDRSVKCADGVYYIHNSGTTNGPWYLWPSVTTNTTSGYRYLTSFNGTEVPAAEGFYPYHDNSWCHWVVRNQADGSIQIINPKLNLYVVVRKFPKSDNTKPNSYGDRDVWLTEEPNADIDYSKLMLYNDDSPYKIAPLPGLNNVSSTDKYTFNSASGNQRSTITWAKDNNNPRKGESREGLIQFYDNNGNGGTPSWTFETNLLSAPTISVDKDNNTFTIIDSNGLVEGYTIRYTTGDGTQDAPTATTGEVYNGVVTITETTTIKAVVVRYGLVLTEVATKTVVPATQCEIPTLTYNHEDKTVTIAPTWPTDVTLKYALNDSDTPDQTYTAPVTIPNDCDIVRAIASKTGLEDSPIASITRVATPTFGFDDAAQGFTLSCATEGATIHYTTDGSEPTTSSTEYSGAVAISGETTVKAIAVKDGYIYSTIAENTYTKTAAPTITFDQYTNTFTLASMTDGAIIHYTTDGTEPTTGSSTYSEAVSLTVASTIKAIAVKAGMVNSTIETKAIGKSNTPVITFSGDDQITITTDPAGAEVYYTTNSTVPTNTNGTSYSSAFDLSSTEDVVQAIAYEADKVSSDVATLTVVVHMGSDDPYLIQSQNNAWATGDHQGFHYYLVPGKVDGGNMYANTSTVFSPTMQWYFKFAGKEGGTLYYNIVNNNGRYMYFHNVATTGFSNGSIYLKESSEFEANSSSDNYKFSIKAQTNGYNIVPKLVAPSNSQPTNVHKGSGNNNSAAITLNNQATSDCSLWKFVLPESLDRAVPFTASTSESVTYYKLHNGIASNSFMTYPSTSGGKVRASATDPEELMLWYLEEKEAASNADWLTYYCIRNAITGEYLYYTGGNPHNSDSNDECFEMRSTYDVSEKGHYLYAWARGHKVDRYYLIPQMLKDETQDNVSSLRRSNTKLNVDATRNNDAAIWQFIESDATVTPPHITYDPATNKIAIACTTSGATIYYTTNGEEVTTQNTAYNEAFTLDADVTIIKAVSAKGGQTSSVATYTVSFQTTVGDDVENQRPYLIQNDNNKWGNGTKVYYMIPDSPNSYANTTNVPRPTMEWFIKYEATEGGTVYYSLQNKVTGEYLYYDSNQSGGNSKGIVLKSSNEYSSSDNGFKFRITPYQTNFNIVPYGLTSGDMYVHKGDANTSPKPITLNSSQNGANSLWNFVFRSALDLTPPFTVSDESSTTFYKMQNVKDPTYNITPPSIGSVVNVSTTSDSSVDWYFEQAQSPTADDWNTYYYIRHGLTGKYLYYAGTNPHTNNAQCFELRSSVDVSAKSRYMFTWVRYHSTAGRYQIVPHFIVNEAQDNTSALKRSNTQLIAVSNRNDDNAAWTFVEASDMALAPPFFTYDAATNKITLACTTPGVAIYYTTNGGDATTSGTAYDEAFTLEAGVTTIKAVSAKGGQTSSVATYRVTVQATISNAAADQRPYLIRNKDNAWTEGAPFFYMIPDSPNSTANTTPIPMERMEWLFKHAVVVNDLQYYYIVNKITGEYLYYDAAKASGTKIVLKAATAYDSSDDGYKFRIAPYPTNDAPTGYNIIPYGLTSGNMYVNKDGNNKSANAVSLSNSQSNLTSQWNFVTKSDLDLSVPFSASDESAANYSYYRIKSKRNDNGYYIMAYASDDKANVSNSTAEEDVNKMKFYLKSAGTDGWAQFYHIIDAETGRYLYCNATQANTWNTANEPFTMSTNNDDRSQYVIVKSPFEDNYYIVPKVFIHTQWNNYSSLVNRDDAYLRTDMNRNALGLTWQFEASTFKCATPTFFYDDVNQQFHISCTTPGTKIYYKGYNEGQSQPTFTFPDDVGTLYTAPFSKQYDYYIAVAARCSDGSDESDPAIGDPSSARFRYHLIDKSSQEIFSIGSNDGTLGLPEAYRSPLVSQYHYYTTNFDTSTNTPTGAEATEVATHIYVTYDVSPLVRLDGTQYYMLRYQNPNNTQLYEEAGDRPKGFPEDTQNTVYYPYTNGKEGFNLYGDQKKDAAFDDGESTRTRFLWYFEGSDPYRVKIRSYNTTGTSYHALPGPYPSYFYTFYGNGGSTTTGHTGAAVHTVLTQTDRTNHQPTEYMILNGTGSNTSSFPYRLMTTAASGPNRTHLVVSSIDHQWLNAAHEDSKYSSRTTNWYQMPELGTDFTQNNKNRQDETTHAVNLWYETIDLGTDFQIEPLQLLPVLHLVDNHGWEIAHWSMENTEACRNRIKQFNSPMVKEYRWYSGEAQTGSNRAITKETGYYKYYINTARPVATTADLTSNWMHVNFDDVSQNLNFYVFYDAKDEYGNDNSYLLDLGGHMAEASGSTISYTANGADYHVGTELKNGVTPPTAMQWLVAANPNLDTENAYTGTTGSPEPGKDADRFDPYSLRIESATTGNYYTVNGSSYAISLTAGTATQFAYTDRADLSRQNRGTTFMAVQGTDGKMRLVVRNSDRAESLNRALDSGGTATTTAATTTTGQTAVLVPTRRNVYTIVRSDGTQAISSTGYTKTLRVPSDIASPLLDDTFYSFYPTLQDAVDKTNALTNETFATRYTDPVFVRYDGKAYDNTPIDLSGSTWYNIRNGSQFMTCEEGQPAFTTTTPTDEQLNDDKFFWTFSGDPYTVTVSSKTTSGAVFANTFIWLGNSTYGWNLVANTPAVDNQYAYLYNDGQGHALQHHETLGQTTAADNLFVEQYDLTTYTYHIINTAGTEAVKYTTQQRSVTPLNYDNLPAAIRSPFIADETLTFYSDAARNTAITTAGEATGGHIYVEYTTGQLGSQRLDLKGTSEYQMRVNGIYVYDNAGTLATTGTPTDNWVLTGSDPYAVEIKSKTGEHSIAYDTSGQTLSLSGTNKTFILLGGSSGTLVELVAATGADIANETYYSIGLDAGAIGLYASTPHAHGAPALQINFSKVTVDDGTVMEIAFSSDMNANLAGKYKAVAGFTVDETITGFTGVFDGDFQEISSTSLPLFAEINGAVVRNVIIREAHISSGNNEGDAGAITDVADGDSRIYNCGVLGGSVSGSGKVGGLVGSLNGSSRVINCFSYANVSGGTYAAGIVGYNSYASKNNDLKTMVMNCMFYGNVESGTNISPVYGGQIIDNSGATGLNNFNYFLADKFTNFITRVNAYNCALGAEERFLTRFEFYRQILNSNLPLASWYARGTTDNYANEMAKWVLETADRNITNPKLYPVLHKHGIYPSIINIDAAHAGVAADVEGTNRNKGYRLGTLNVSINLGTGAPLAARLTTTVKYLNITDKDFDRYNFNYYKVQLPYYNEVGTGNYTDNKVVTGWKITSIEGGTPGTFKAEDSSEGYNFADRDCTQKDLYRVTGRVFSQGAYFDVPNGVTGITIEPVWAKAVYLADPCYDKTYTKDFSNDNGNASDITAMGTRYTNGDNYLINGSSQKVYTTMSNAIEALSRPSGSSVYDYAVVLVGNYHHYYGNSSIINDKNGFTIMSADLDFDNEPDNCFIYQHTNRQPVSPIRFDFLCWSGIGMAQKPSNSTRMPDIGIFNPRGWFEVTNTCLTRFYQFEYDWSTKDADQDGSPLILLGGIYEQFVSSNKGAPTHTKYIHLGSNAWFKMFNNGIHADWSYFTPHKPISVTGGDYDLFYLSGMFRPDATADEDHAECYISGGYFGEVAGAGMEKINGDVYWQIDHADIEAFYGGGINAAQPVQGDITTDITNSNVTTFCGGPKFGDMVSEKNVNTTATGCTFGQYFGAGYGGTSLNRIRKYNLTDSRNYNFNSSWVSSYSRAYETSTKTTPNGTGGPTNDITVNAIATNYEYELFPFSGFADNNNVGRFYVNYASLSLATTRNVTSTLTGCKITGNFYGGGSLGKVEGDVTSTLTDCEVKGNVFGAGFSAAAPTVEVMAKTGFTTEPWYDGNSGFYIQGVYPASVTYTWSSKGSNSSPFTVDNDGHWIHTDIDMTTLGTVTGTATLTIGGNSVIGTAGDAKTGNVYGGGDKSAVNNTTTPTNAKTIVTLQGNTQVLGNVFGGGNEGLVSGSATVNIE